MNIRGLYFYGPHYNLTGVWKKEKPDSTCADFIKDFKDVEEARKFVFKQNGWNEPLAPITKKYVTKYYNYMNLEFIKLLEQTRLNDKETVIANLDKLGFFKAPASTKYHLSEEGGLAKHSVSVCKTALKLREIIVAEKPELAEKLPVDSVILVSLLHDICKAEIYKLGFSNVKNNQTGVWEKVPTYKTDYSYFPAGHGEKSVIRLLMWGIKLTKDEVLAIRWHMSAWDLPFQSYEEMANLNAAKEKYPLVSLLQCADNLSATIYESDAGEQE